jgi:hypothetical protein
MSSSQKQNADATLKAEAVSNAEVATGDHGQAPITDEAYERAAQSAIAGMKRGFHMGGSPYVSREELHDRKALRKL